MAYLINLNAHSEWRHITYIYGSDHHSHISHYYVADADADADEDHDDGDDVGVVVHHHDGDDAGVEWHDQSGRQAGRRGFS